MTLAGPAAVMMSGPVPAANATCCFCAAVSPLTCTGFTSTLGYCALNGSTLNCDHCCSASTPGLYGVYHSVSEPDTSAGLLGLALLGATLLGAAVLGAAVLGLALPGAAALGAAVLVQPATTNETL